PVEGVDSAGAVYVYTRNGGTWTFQQKLGASDAASDDQFGHSLQLSSDGDTLAVGADEKDLAGVGYAVGGVYVFTRSGGTWTQQQKLLPNTPTSAAYFGTSVSFTWDGNMLAVGAYGRRAVYVFTRSGATWTERTIVTNDGT